MQEVGSLGQGIAAAAYSLSAARAITIAYSPVPPCLASGMPHVIQIEWRVLTHV